jgi:hypothetical protein
MGPGCPGGNTGMRRFLTESPILQEVRQANAIRPAIWHEACRVRWVIGASLPCTLNEDDSGRIGAIGVVDAKLAWWL